MEIEPILVDKKDTKKIMGGISLRSIDYLVECGLLRPVRIGRRVFFRYRDLQLFARSDHRNFRERSEELRGANE